MPGKKLTPRKLQGLRTKQKIFKTAIKLFAKKSYNTVTVDEICQTAKVSKGAFYAHFASKEEIIILQFNVIDDLHANFLSKLDPGLASSAKLISFIEATFDFFKNLGIDIIRVVYLSQIDPEEKTFSIINENRPLYTAIETIVREGQAKGEFRGDLNPQEITYMIIRCIRGATMDWLLYNGNKDLAVMGSQLISTLISGLHP
jgi:AcrR family transcriptional regulator